MVDIVLVVGIAENDMTVEKFWAALKLLPWTWNMEW